MTSRQDVKLSDRRGPNPDERNDPCYALWRAGRIDFPRANLGQREQLWRLSAHRISVAVRYGGGIAQCRPYFGARIQPPADSRRPISSERQRLLGRDRDERRAADGASLRRQALVPHARKLTDASRRACSPRSSRTCAPSALTRDSQRTTGFAFLRNLEHLSEKERHT